MMKVNSIHIYTMKNFDNNNNKNNITWENDLRYK